MDFKSFDTACTAPVLQFEEQDGPGIERALALGTSSLGAHDFEGPILLGNDVGCVSVDCDGQCIPECDPGTGDTTCFCDGAGDCQPGVNNSLTLSTTSMIVAHM
jgi:hypothetical protein